MKILLTHISDLVIIKPVIFKDQRGYFYESYNEEQYKKAGINNIFVQDNQSLSKKGVIRGLHYQDEPYAQAKLVRVLKGKIFDVAVDLRKSSLTYGKCFGIELSSINKLQLFIPKGFAHGFSVLSNYAVVHYKTDALYNPASEKGILYNDPDLGIDWKINPDMHIVSDRDLALPLFRNVSEKLK